MSEGERKLISKKLDCLELFILADRMTEVKNSLESYRGMSEKTRRLFLELTDSLNADVGHLKCENLTNVYIVEEGYNVTE